MDLLSKARRMKTRVDLSPSIPVVFVENLSSSSWKSESWWFRGAISNSRESSNKGRSQGPIKLLVKPPAGHFKFLMPKDQQTWKVRIPARRITANNPEEIRVSLYNEDREECFPLQVHFVLCPLIFTCPILTINAQIQQSVTAWEEHGAKGPQILRD